MIKNCIRCKTEMKEAYQSDLPQFQIQKKGGLKEAFSKCSRTEVYVCPNCGYVELVASNLELFK